MAESTRRSTKGSRTSGAESERSDPVVDQGEGSGSEVRDGSDVSVVCINVPNERNEPYVDRTAVTALYEMVRRSLPDAPFYCVAGELLGYPEGINILEPYKHHFWPGWWQKLTIFRPDFPLEGRILFLDLDVVITGDLNRVLEYGMPEFVMAPETFSHAEEIHRGNSSVFLINRRGPIIETIWNRSQTGFDNIKKKHPGDQDLINGVLKELQVDDWPLAQGMFLSFKRDIEALRTNEGKRRRYIRDPHRENYRVDDAVGVLFHGDPKPWDEHEGLTDEIVEAYYPRTPTQAATAERNQRQDRFLGGMRVVRQRPKRRR